METRCCLAPEIKAHFWVIKSIITAVNSRRSSVYTLYTFPRLEFGGPPLYQMENSIQNLTSVENLHYSYTQTLHVKLYPQELIRLSWVTLKLILCLAPFLNLIIVRWTPRSRNYHWKKIFLCENHQVFPNTWLLPTACGWHRWYHVTKCVLSLFFGLFPTPPSKSCSF